MDSSEITSGIIDHMPETLLLVGGLIALLIVITYVKDRNSAKYKLMMFLGVVFGAIMAYEAVTKYGDWPMSTSIIILISAFALIIRPFRDVHFAVIIAALIMGIVYIALAGLNGCIIFDNIDLTFLSEGWPRVIIAFLCGSVVYMVLNFGESLVKMAGKILNWWPLLLVLALICITESVLMLTGNGSIADFIDTSSMRI